jgi:hypothetical protein
MRGVLLFDLGALLSTGVFSLGVSTFVLLLGVLEAAAGSALGVFAAGASTFEAFAGVFLARTTGAVMTGATSSSDSDSDSLLSTGTGFSTLVLFALEGGSLAGAAGVALAASALFLAASAALFLASSSAHSLPLFLCSSFDTGAGDALPVVLVLPFLAGVFDTGVVDLDLLDELVAASAFFLAASAALFLASSSAHSLARSLCSSIDSGGGDAMPLILVLPFLACTGDGLVSFRFIVPDLTSFFDVRWKIQHFSTNFKLLS